MIGNSATSQPFWGRPACRVETNGLRVYESSYKAGDALARHAHDKAHFCYVINGAYTETLSDGAHDRLPGAVIYYPPQTGHAERHYAAGTHLLIEIDSAWLDRHGCSKAPESSISLTSGHGPSAARRCLDASRIDGPLGGLRVEGLALELYAAIALGHRPVARGTERWLDRTQAFLDTQFRDPLTLAEIAGCARVHPAHLVRAFRRRFGCSIGAYVRRLRLAHAVQDMIESDKPLAAVALDAGFADQCHLTRMMKTHLAATPAALRRSHREKHS